MAERSRLTAQTDVNTVVLEVAQRPVAAYAFLAFFGFFAGIGLGACLPPLAPIAIPFALASFSVFLLAMVVRPRFRIEVSPGEVRLDGWSGTLPRPASEVLPLVGTTLDWRHGAEVNGVQLWVVEVRNGARTLVIPSVRCKRSELADIAERLEGMQLLAEAVQGAGEDEVPDELATLRQKPPRSEPESLR